MGKTHTKHLESNGLHKKSNPQNKSTIESSNISQKKHISQKKDKKNTSLRLDKKTLKALKIRAIEEDTSIQNLIETLIVNYLNES